MKCNIFVCNICGHWLSSEKSLQIHGKRSHKIECDLCKCKVTSNNVLIMHKLREHSDDYEESDEN